MKDLWNAFRGSIIVLAWVPLGLLGLWVEKNLPREYQLPFFILLLGGVVATYFVRDKTAKKDAK